MSLTVSEGATGTYTPPVAGTFTARCIGLIDLGTQASTFEGETKHAHKLLVQFELTDPDNRRDDGSAHIVSKRFTASLHPKAALRGFLEAWRGRPFTPQELAGFHLKALLGLPCLLSLVHATKGDRTYCNIAGAMKLPKGMPAPAGELELTHFDLSAPDWVQFELLPERIRAQIEQAPEFAQAAAGRPQRVNIPPPAAPAPAASPAARGMRAMAQAVAPAAPAAAPVATPGAALADMDDDIPF